MNDQIAQAVMALLAAILGGSFVPWKKAWERLRGGFFKGGGAVTNGEFPVTQTPSDETLAYIHAVCTAIQDADDELILECLDAGDTVYEAMKAHRDALAQKSSEVEP